MPQKQIFISVLGTGFYSETIYYNPETQCVSPKSRFIQQAMMHQLDVAHWSADDEVLILLTDKARTDNWDVRNNTRIDRKQNCVEYIGLRQELADMHLPCHVRTLDIPDGLNTDEIWQIFSRLYDTLPADAQLYFDLTHGFRYLPMLVLVFARYAKYLKHIEVRSITYGNFEAIDHIGAPIIDLIPLLSLQEWTGAAAQFTDCADATKMSALASLTLSPLLRENNGSDKSLNQLNQAIREIGQLVADIKCCRLKEIYDTKKILNIRQHFDALPTHFIQPLNPILSTIKESLIDHLTDDAIANGFAIARWCLAGSLYQQCATILQENIISDICIEQQLDVIDLKSRWLIGSALTIYNERLPEESWKCADDEKPSIHHLLQSPLVARYARTMYNLSTVRNDLNHAGMRQGAAPTSKIAKNIARLVDTVGSIVHNTTPTAAPITIPPLINLSNHPLSQWSDSQKAAALTAYSAIIDYPFPPISPHASIDDISAEAHRILTDIVSHYTTSVAIHVMGEMTFTYAFVAEAQTRGIQCIASTTDRRVVDLGNNRKEVQFTFVTFRPYF